jgi:hypothetical protein
MTKNRPRFGVKHNIKNIKTKHQKVTIIKVTSVLPCIVIDLFLNNQQVALIIQIYSLIKLYMFRASSLPIIRSFLVYIRHW